MRCGSADAYARGQSSDIHYHFVDQITLIMIIIIISKSWMGLNDTITLLIWIYGYLPFSGDEFPPLWARTNHKWMQIDFSERRSNHSFSGCSSVYLWSLKQMQKWKTVDRLIGDCVADLPAESKATALCHPHNLCGPKEKCGNDTILMSLWIIHRRQQDRYKMYRNRQMP